MTDQIPDEAMFARALGLNPDIIEAGIEVRYIQGVAHIRYAVMQPVAPGALAQAFAATMPRTDEPKKPVKKAAAKRATPRKRLESVKDSGKD